MTATEKLLLALARKEVSYGLGWLHASHAWIDGDVVHVATVDENGLFRRQHRVELDDDGDVATHEEPVTVCAECRGDVTVSPAPGAELRTDVYGREYVGGCETCATAVERERSAA